MLEPQLNNFIFLSKSTKILKILSGAWYCTGNGYLLNVTKKLLSRIIKGTKM